MVQKVVFKHLLKLIYDQTVLFENDIIASVCNRSQEESVEEKSQVY
jgi:hypothetical protein